MNSGYTPATPRGYEPNSPAVAALLAVYSGFSRKGDGLPQRKDVGDENKKPIGDAKVGEGQAGHDEIADNNTDNSETGHAQAGSGEANKTEVVETKTEQITVNDTESTNGKIEATKSGDAEPSDNKIANTESTDADHGTEASKSMHRRVTRLKLKADVAPASSDGLRRFALRANYMANAMHTFPDGYKVPCPALTSKMRPMIFASNYLHDWRDFRLGLFSFLPYSQNRFLN